MSWREDLAIGILRAERFFVGSGMGVEIPVNELKATDPSQKVTMFTDFNGDLFDGTTELLEGEGSGTGNTVAIVAGQGGKASILTSSADAAIGANGSSLGGANLNWRADSGGLVAECRLQVDDITTVMIFFGFTDVVATTVEAPIFLVTTAIDSDADNACGILYDTDGTTEQWCHGGVKATTDTTPAYSGGAPVNATDVILRVEVSALGAVQGYIDGVAIPGGAVADAITITTPVIPIIFVANRTTAARTVLVDYLWVQADR